MKLAIFAFLSSAFVTSAFTYGTLTVGYGNNQVTIKGALTNLPKSQKDAGIHVHTGEVCTDGGKKTTAEINTFIGGHLMSNNIDGWAYPAGITYNTDGAGKGTVDVSAKYFTLATKGTDAIPSIEGRCIVMHGVSSTEMSDRAAIGKIVTKNGATTAVMGKYPGPNKLSSTPSGTLTVTVDTDGVVKLKGTVQGLAKSLTKAGIHIHTGTDCTGGSDLKTTDAVNKVVGGHLYSKGDGWLTTKYTSDDKGAATVDISTPENSYHLINTMATAKIPAVENHCIVIHNAAGARIGIGQIKCTGTKPADIKCEAKTTVYPFIVPTTTTAKPKPKVESSATQMFAAFSALVACAVLAF